MGRKVRKKLGKGYKDGHRSSVSGRRRYNGKKAEYAITGWIKRMRKKYVDK